MTNVAEFHGATDSHIAAYPQVPSKDQKKLRTNLVMEEAREVVAAIEQGALPEIAKELCDLIYVAMGTALACGINLDPVWDKVHESNMTKGGSEKRKDGKVLKPSDFKKIDIKPLIDDQIKTGIMRAQAAASKL